MIFTISLLISCRTARTTENTQISKEKTEQVKEAHQKKDVKTNILAQIDSIIIVEDNPMINANPKTDVSQSRNIKPSKSSKRTIKIYGLRKDVTSSNKIVSKEKVQVKKKGTSKTKAETKEQKPTNSTAFIGIVIVLLCLLMIAGLVCWKIAVQ